MNRDQAQTAVAGSALIVGAIYSYRKLIEPVVPASTRKGGKATDMIGYGPPPPVGQFITAWGFVFTCLALVAQVAPSMGGSFAILVAVSDILGNGTALADDVNGRVSGKTTPPQPTNAKGAPILGENESTADYDKRMKDYLLKQSGVTP